MEEDDDNEDDDLDDNEEGTSEKSPETAVSNEEKDNEDRQLVMDKHFILPKRSTRSSRIIKPNKRLLEVGGISSKKNSNEVQSVKSKPKNYFGLGDFSADAASTSSASSVKLAKEPFSSFGSMKLNSSFVLRKPLLQFQTEKSGSFAKSGLLLATSSSAISTTNAISFGSHNSANSGKLNLIT